MTLRQRDIHGNAVCRFVENPTSALSYFNIYG